MHNQTTSKRLNPKIYYPVHFKTPSSVGSSAAKKTSMPDQKVQVSNVSNIDHRHKASSTSSSVRLTKNELGNNEAPNSMVVNRRVDYLETNQKPFSRLNQLDESHKVESASLVVGTIGSDDKPASALIESAEKKKDNKIKKKESHPSNTISLKRPRDLKQQLEAISKHIENLDDQRRQIEAKYSCLEITPQHQEALEKELMRKLLLVVRDELYLQESKRKNRKKEQKDIQLPKGEQFSQSRLDSEYEKWISGHYDRTKKKEVAIGKNKIFPNAERQMPSSQEASLKELDEQLTKAIQEKKRILSKLYPVKPELRRNRIEGSERPLEKPVVS